LARPAGQEEEAMSPKRDALRNLMLCVVMFNAGVISVLWFQARSARITLDLIFVIECILLWDGCKRGLRRNTNT
jgi:hypothetical protein